MNKKQKLTDMVCLILLVGGLLFGFWLRNTQRGFETYDMLYDYSPWYEHFRTKGGFPAISTLQSDYPVSYLYILAGLSYLQGSGMAKIKLVSVIFELIAAGIVFAYARLLYPALIDRWKASISALIFFFIPTIFMNGAVWGQTDIIYTCFLIASLYLLAREKWLLALITYGLAFAFKLQAIFFLPFLGIYWLKTQKFPITYFLVIPAIVFLVGLPAVLLGCSWDQVYGVYLSQATEYPRLVFNFGNLYAFLPEDYNNFAIPGIIFTGVLLFGLLMMVLHCKRLILDKWNLPDLAIVSILTCAFFLPGMHERYMFSAIAIGIVYAIAHPQRFPMVFILWMIDINAYLPVLYGMQAPLDYRIEAVFLIALLFVFGWYFFKPDLQKSKATTASL